MDDGMTGDYENELSNLRRLFDVAAMPDYEPESRCATTIGAKDRYVGKRFDEITRDDFVKFLGDLEDLSASEMAHLLPMIVYLSLKNVGDDHVMSSLEVLDYFGHEQDARLEIYRTLKIISNPERKDALLDALGVLIEAYARRDQTGNTLAPLSRMKQYIFNN